jgi:hypothetical protein
VNSSRRNTLSIGAASGAALALTGLAFFVGRAALGAMVRVEGDPSLQVTSGALYLLVLVVAAVLGLGIAALSYGAGTAAEPEAVRFPLRYLLPVSSILSATVAYAVLKIGVGGFGDIDSGLVTIGALPLAATMLVMGAVAGAVTSTVVDALSRPDLYGFSGKAAPADVGEVMSTMTSAVSLPLVAVTVGAAFTVPLSLVLIELSGNAAVILFSVIGALVLGAAALAAARPWDKPRA